MTADGFAPRLERAAAGSTPSVTLEIGNDLVVHLLTDREEPVPDASATLIPLSTCEAAVRAFAELLPSTRSATDGTVEFQHVPDGVYAIRLIAKGRISSNVAPVVVSPKESEFRVRLPEALPLKAAITFPPRVPASPGTALAFWKDSRGWPQWAEERFPGGDSSFELDGSASLDSVRLLAWTASGLSSRCLARRDLESYESLAEVSIPMELPTSLEGTLEDGVEVQRLIVQPLLSGSCRLREQADSFSVPVGPDHRFVIQGIAPTMDRLRIVAPGLGDAEVPLAVATGNLGVVKIPPRLSFGGTVVWPNSRAWGGAEIEVLSGDRILCQARTTDEGEFACATGVGDVRQIGFRVLYAGADLRLAPLSGDSSGRLGISTGKTVQLEVKRVGSAGVAKDLLMEIGPDHASDLSRRALGKSTLFLHSLSGSFALHTSEEGDVRIATCDPRGGPTIQSAVIVPKPGSPARATLLLPEGPAVFGRVLEGISRNPVAGAEVEFGTRTLAMDQADLARILHTAAEGKWRFDEAREGTYYLSARAPGYSIVAREVFVPTDSHLRQDLLLQRPGRIRGKVNGLPERSKATLLLTSTTWWIGWNNFRGEVDSNGQFAFENVRPDRYNLRLQVNKTPAGIISRGLPTQVRPGETTEIQFDLRSGIIVAGKALLGEDLAAEGSKIAFRSPARQSRSYTTDSTVVGKEGTYWISLSSPGQYRTIIYLPGRSTGVDLGQLLEIGSESDQNRDLLFSNAKIRARVLDQRGIPLSAASVEVLRLGSAKDGAGNTSEEKDIVDQSFTSEAGAFEFGPLTPGEYRLDISARDSARREVGPLSLSMDQILDLPDIFLESELTLKVGVVDPQGSPQEGVLVIASPASHPDEEWGVGKTDANGEIVLRGLPSGAYDVAGLLPGWPPVFSEKVMVPREDSAPPLLLQLSPGGGLEVRVMDKSGSPVPEVSPRVMDARGRDLTNLYSWLADFVKVPWSTDGDGRARLDAVASGEYSLKVGSGKNSDVRSTGIVAGQTSRVTLVLVGEETP